MSAGLHKYCKCKTNTDINMSRKRVVISTQIHEIDQIDCQHYIFTVSNLKHNMSVQKKVVEGNIIEQHTNSFILN